MIKKAFCLVFLFLLTGCNARATTNLKELFARGVPALRRVHAERLLDETASLLRVSKSGIKSSFVEVNEVATRNEIQSEETFIPLNNKVGFINRIRGSIKLAESPIEYEDERLEKRKVRIEVGSMVSHAAVPQMKSTEEILKTLEADPRVIYSVLVPNSKGIVTLKRALDSRKDQLIPEVAVFVSPSERFSEKKLKCSVADSLRRAELVINEARYKLPRRGFIPMVAGSPFGDVITKENVRLVANALSIMGCQQIVLADTTGVGTPEQIFEIVQHVSKFIPLSQLALQLHGRVDNAENTLKNALAAYIAGIRSFDGSVGGVGGCPFSPESPGNIDTALLLTLFEDLNIKTHWDLEKILEVRSNLPGVLGFGNIMVKDRTSL